jgi:two-component system, NarL family, nitrate/nitrite response regulator NarL
VKLKNPAFEQRKRRLKGNQLVDGSAIFTRIMIADDQALNRAALRKLLERAPQFEIVGEAVDGRETLTQVKTIQPDVLLLGLSMPQLSRWNVLRSLAKTSLKIRTILLPAAIGREQTIEALLLGVRGILPKSTASQLLYKSIRTVMAGEYWVDSKIVAELIRTLHASSNVAPSFVQPAGNRLTRRELEVLNLVAEGCTNKDIAEQLTISNQTTKHHLSRIYEKTGISNRMQLALSAVNKSLASDS